jgi:hypothetical protein
VGFLVRKIVEKEELGKSRKKWEDKTARNLSVCERERLCKLERTDSGSCPMAGQLLVLAVLNLRLSNTELL